MKKFFNALKNYGRAFKVIFRHGFAGYFVVPSLLTLALIIVFIVLGSLFFGDLSNWLVGILPDWRWLQSKAATIVMDVLIWILAALFFVISFKQVVLVVLSPVLSHLSEKVENKLTGLEPPKIGFKEFLSDVWRGLILNMGNLALELILTFFAWLLSFIPIVGFVISPILIFLIQSFFSGFGLVDYTLERKRYNLFKSNQFAYKNIGEMMGVGAGYVLTMYIPLIGWIFAPTLGTVASTLVTMENLSGQPVEVDPVKIEAKKRELAKQIEEPF